MQRLPWVELVPVSVDEYQPEEEKDRCADEG